jgi:benzodiazapine receptor
MGATKLAFWLGVECALRNHYGDIWPWMVALPFALNLVFNFSFTYFQFGLKNNLLASIDILLVVGTLIWALIAIWYASPELRWVVYANIPYLLWGTFATVLQLTITYLNK